VSERWLRIIAAVVAFAVVAYLGVLLSGTFTDQSSNSWALITAIALAAGLVIYAAVEYLQTGGFASIAGQFDTRTIVLIPLAIAINIILGQTVAAALKVPVYLDSIGTILVGVLAGPIPGALTGFLANVLWTYVVPPPFQGSAAAAFAIVALVIGLIAGAVGRMGWMRPRPDRSIGELAIGAVIALALVGLMIWYAFSRFYGEGFTFFADPSKTETVFVVLGWLIAALFIGALLGFLALLFVRRDLTVAYVVVAGIGTGIICALISAPISANLFSGVTGSGTDFLVAAFRAAGSTIQEATFQQGLLSDPVDKLVTFFVVYLILSAMARRTKARFPQGERLVEGGGMEAIA
jgi:energy-coupling factor transport system substrate-specific component